MIVNICMPFQDDILNVFKLQSGHDKIAQSNIFSSFKENSKTKRVLRHIVAHPRPCLQGIKLKFILRLKIKRNDWLFADTCPQAANHCALF